MKIWKRLLAIAFALNLCFTLAAVGASADGVSTFHIANGSDGETWSLAVLIAYGGTTVAYTARNDEYADKELTLNDLDNQKTYSLRYFEAVGNVMGWEVLDYDGGSAFTLTPPRGGESVVIAFYSAEGKIETAQSTVAEVVKVYDDGTAVLGLSAGLSGYNEAAGPGLVVNADGAIVGILCAERMFYTLTFDEQTFGGTGGGTATGGTDGGGTGGTDTGGTTATGGSSTDLPEKTQKKEKNEIPWAAIAGVCAVVAAAAYLLRKKKPAVPVTPGIPTPDNGGVARYGDTEPLPGAGDFAPPVTPPAPQTGALFLVCSGGYMDGRIYPINSDQITFGRDASCTIKYPADQAGISRQHATLRVRDGAMTLTDTSSTGTYLKRLGGRMTPKQTVSVSVGDVFYLGERKNRFEIVQR